MTINWKLRIARTEKGLTQEEMANLLDLSRFGYNQKENGINPFTEIEIKNICKILDKDPNDLFFD